MGITQMSPVAVVPLLIKTAPLVDTKLTAKSVFFLLHQAVNRSKNISQTRPCTCLQLSLCPPYSVRDLYNSHVQFKVARKHFDLLLC